MFKELVPTLACLNSSSAGISLFWSSVVKCNRIFRPTRKRRAFGTSGIRLSDFVIERNRFECSAREHRRSALACRFVNSP